MNVVELILAVLVNMHIYVIFARNEKLLFYNKIITVQCFNTYTTMEKS